MKKPAYAPLEARWNDFEDRAPRALVLGFHSYLRDNEIAAGRRLTYPERHKALGCFAKFYPEILTAYRAVFGNVGI